MQPLKDYKRRHQAPEECTPTQVLALPLGERVDLGGHCFVADDSAQVTLTGMLWPTEFGIFQGALCLLWLRIARNEALCVMLSRRQWA